jgi:biotin transport system substrate-specific component
MRVLPFKSEFTSALIASVFGGIFIIHLFGTPWLAWSTGLSVKNAAIASATLLPGDTLKAIATAFIAQTYLQTFSPAAGARA